MQLKHYYITKDTWVTTNIQALLHESPLYTVECDLYPANMRRVVNRDRNTDAAVTQELRDYIEAQYVTRNRSLSTHSSIADELDLHPGAARVLQQLHGI
ncbi:hypothetical protein IWW50_001905 [Coemansia erecta]|nr:hypothetical protein IWW50_001905 [Coemansia erecta]